MANHTNTQFISSKVQRYLCAGADTMAKPWTFPPRGSIGLVNGMAPTARPEVADLDRQLAHWLRSDTSIPGCADTCAGVGPSSKANDELETLPRGDFADAVGRIGDGRI